MLSEFTTLQYLNEMTLKYFCVLFNSKSGPFRHSVLEEFALKGPQSQLQTLPDKSLECVANGLSFFFFFDDLHKKCIPKPHFSRAPTSP